MAGDNQFGWISVPMVVDAITKGAERWMAQHGDTNTVARNADKFIRYRPEGLPPHVSGPVIM